MQKGHRHVMVIATTARSRINDPARKQTQGYLRQLRNSINYSSLLSAVCSQNLDVYVISLPQWYVVLDSIAIWQVPKLIRSHSLANSLD